MGTIWYRQRKAEQDAKTMSTVNTEDMSARKTTWDEYHCLVATRSFVHTSPPPEGLLPALGDAHPMFPGVISITGPSYPSYQIGVVRGVTLWRTTVVYRESAYSVKSRRKSRLTESRRRWAAWQ